MTETDWAPKIRDAREEDVPAVVALYADDALGQAREQATEPLPASYWAAFEAIRTDPRHRLVVIDDGEIAATLQLYFLPHLVRLGTERAQIEAVRVASHRRGAGLGRALLEWAIDEARRRGTHVGMKLALDPTAR